ncbi:Heavy-metal-associated domain-containing protein [Thermoflexibacter ruber]|uniref:Heavy-metal-associated domain-containing protein n=2 Tax=Thermoflexibacter ruber TaxID=1003 RepID=A0A1I2G923_9BACT|nr:Heavy-metal-associated domain-containing protein [Thermoflexibacter ruber]
MGCVAQVTPFLNAATNIQSWEVDIQHPEKVLTVKGDIDKKQLIQLIEKAGFKAREN